VEIGDCGLNPHRKDAKKGKTWALEFFATLRCKNPKSKWGLQITGFSIRNPQSEIEMGERF
jgi:hypothetical protein